MYKVLYDYAMTHNLSVSDYYKEKKLGLYLLIDNNAYNGFEIVDIKKICPDAGPKSRTAEGCTPLIEKFAYIFNRNEKKNKYYWDELEKGAKEYTNISSLQTVYTVLNQIYNDADLNAKVMSDFNDTGVKSDVYMSFKIEGTPLEDLNDWKIWFESFYAKANPNSAGGDEGAEEIISLITGNSVKAKDAPYYQMSAPVLGRGAYLSAFKYNAFQSYGLEGNLNSRMGMDEVKVVSAALEDLLKSKRNYKRNYDLLYFYDKEIPEEDDPIFATTTSIASNLNDGNNKEDVIVDEDAKEESNSNTKEKEANTAYKNLLEYFSKDNTVDLLNYKNKYKDVKYHLMKFTLPTDSRVQISDYHEGTVIELIDNISKWREDSKICAYSGKEYTLDYLYRVFKKYYGETKPGKPDSKVLGDMNRALQSVYFNKQIPRRLFDNACSDAIRLITHTSKETKGIISALQIIKIYLIREGKSMQSKLDTNCTNTGYILGRLMAVYGKIQSDSVNARNEGEKKTLNKGLMDRYGQAVINKPGMISLAEALALKHIKKLDNSKQTYYNKLISELWNMLDTSAMEKKKGLTAEEKGMFSMGYWQQNASLYTKRDKQDDAVDNVEN